MSTILSEMFHKVRSPFWATFIIIWLIRNWFLIYTFSQLSNEKFINAKLNYITMNLTRPKILYEFIAVASYSILAVFVSHFLNTLAIALGKLNRHHVKPFIVGLINDSEIISIDDYDKKKRQLESYKKSAEDEKERADNAILHLQNMQEKLNQDRNKIETHNQQLVSEIEDLRDRWVKNEDELRNKHSGEIASKNEKIKSLQSDLDMIALQNIPNEEKKENKRTQVLLNKEMPPAYNDRDLRAIIRELSLVFMVGEKLNDISGNIENEIPMNHDDEFLVQLLKYHIVDFNEESPIPGQDFYQKGLYWDKFTELYKQKK